MLVGDVARISSMRSSVVTMPAVPPYSSMTTHISMPSARMRSMSASPSSVTGTGRRGRARAATVVVDCSSGATVKACLMCTTPMRSSRSPSSTTGNRECPVAEQAMTRSRTLASRSRHSTVTRGVIRSSAVSSPNRSERFTRSRCPRRWSLPRRVAHQRRQLLRRTPGAELFGRLDTEAADHPVGRAVEAVDDVAEHRREDGHRSGVARATDNGWAMARFFGTSSPSTIDNDVAMSNDSAREMPPAAPEPSPSALSPGVISCARTGSAM